MNVSFQTVSLQEIADPVGGGPSSRLKQSVRKLGIVQPVLLAESNNHSDGFPFLIIDGNRRIRAAKGARHKQVPALVVSGLTVEERAQVTLVANGYRTANYLTEFWAIKQLERANFANEEIERIAGFGDTAIATRTMLSHLHRNIFVALRNGRVNQASALAVSKLPRSDQQELADILSDRGRLLKREIDLIAKRGARSLSPPVVIPTPESPAHSNRIHVEFARPTAEVAQVPYPPFGDLSNPTPSLNQETPSEDSSENRVTPNILATASRINNGYKHRTSPVSIPEDQTWRKPSNGSEPAPHNLTSVGSNSLPPFERTEPIEIADTPATDSPIITTAPPTIAPITDLLSANSQVERLMRKTVLAAQVMDYSLEDFIALATTQWNTVISSETHGSA